MTGKQLKNAILQLAIQGKLVPQDANDEPASVLLARIRKEKEQLVKAGKLKPACRQAGKKDLETTPITDEEKPFEIPESWEWCRLGYVINLLSGQDLTPNRYFDTPKGIPYITGASHFDNGNLKISRWTDSPTSVSKKGDLLITCKGTVGTMAYNNIGDVHIARQVMAITPIETYLPYIKIFLEFSVAELEKQAHSIIPGISRDVLLSSIVPLPPLSEQRRIVTRVEELMPLVEEFGAAQEKLNRLNEALPEALKKSILQQAIQGKLVAQDANDEPASALLAQIRKEKEQLLKAGKLKPACRQAGKKDLETTPITDEEKPFEIPESWEWVNIPMIGNSQLGKTKNPNQRAGKMFPYLCSINVYWEGIRMDTLKEMLFTESEQEKYRIEKGDLVVCEGGDCGRTSIWEKEETVLYQNALHRVRFYQGINPYYIQYCMFLYCNNGLINEYKKGETIQHLVKNKLDAIPFPLPPLAEQRRIVARVEELMAMVDGLKGGRTSFK